MIDNYDSFTYIIVQYFEQLGQRVKVVTNDECTVDELVNHQALALTEKITAIIIGPGPGRPEDAGVTLDVIKRFVGRIPIFGICLGHQAIAMVYGAQIIQANNIMHGRLSAVYHHAQGVFSGLPLPVDMTRYHSLVIDKTTLPKMFDITGWTQVAAILKEGKEDTDDAIIDDIMGIRHQSLDLEGVQFHPESILSEAGLQLLNNFLLQHDLAIFTQADIAAGRHRQPLASGYFV